MSSLAIADSMLAGLAIVTEPSAFLPALAKATASNGIAVLGFTAMRIVRIRYRPGERAILQVEFKAARSTNGIVPASIWLHANKKPGKSQRLAGVYEPLSGAVVYFFPADPRVPQLQAFLANPSAFAKTLLPGIAPPAPAPQLVRFRPGLGATFRWAVDGQDAIYVKIQNESEPALALELLRQVEMASRGKSFAAPTPAGADAGLNAYAMHEVRGSSFGDVLARAPEAEAEAFTKRLLTALREFRCCEISPRQSQTREHFENAARSAAKTVSLLCSQSGPRAAAIAAAIERTPVPLHQAVTHCDIKLEHVIESGGKMVFLDLDSAARADPLYDLAMLDVRIATAADAKTCRVVNAIAARRIIKAAAAGPDEPDGARRFAWLQACAALQLARHHAQSTRPRGPRMVAAALALCHTITGSEITPRLPPA